MYNRIVIAVFLISGLFLIYSFFGHLIIHENDVIERNEPVEFDDTVGIDDPNDYSRPPLTEEDFLPRTYPLPDNLDVNEPE